MGLTESILSGIRTYLDNRMFRTKVGRVHTSRKVSPSRISHGTFLNLLLFSTYINDGGTDLCKRRKVLEANKKTRTIHLSLKGPTKYEGIGGRQSISA
ncbi:hypothetical protein Smp_158210 [Schistosoma mansoni]|uniref:Ovule protein n=1 Tax=Schistosoma mansoni TaxID=6183 RepID=G4VM12_SCHMA|nr:hypothetical protein Smp_158210 [Schistosoma mansoni]|eukprot:XP_018653116.1 hypothetical protein Smp_158210 [Schistosoma mansoni]